MPTFGPEIRPPGHYTHCVASADYQDPPSLAQSGVFSFFQFMLCEYLLGGKLVCLAGGQDECAIGTVVGLEAVGAGKKGFDALDNDFSFNVLLAPFQTQDFRWYWQDAWHVQQPGVADNVVDPHRVRDDLVRNGPSGWMMVDPKNAPVPLPQPVDQSGAPHWPIDKRQDPGTATWPVDGYGVLWRLKGAFQNFTGLGVTVEYYDLSPEGDNLHKLWDTPSNDEWPAPPGPGDPTSPDLFVPIPVLHCECEGSRIFAVCQAMDPFLNLLSREGARRGTRRRPGLPRIRQEAAIRAGQDWTRRVQHRRGHRGRCHEHRDGPGIWRPLSRPRGQTRQAMMTCWSLDRSPSKSTSTTSLSSRAVGIRTPVTPVTPSCTR